MTLDYLSIISNETSRIVNAFERDRQAAVPWSDRWTVATVARHVAATHHVVAEIVEGRPVADFGLLVSSKRRRKTPPSLSDGSAPALLRCSSNCRVFPSAMSVGRGSRPGAMSAGGLAAWRSRPFVHRTDTDAAQAKELSVSPDVAADGIDEFLDVFVAASRAAHDAPIGPTMRFECSDRNERWWLDLSEQGKRIVSREPRDASVRIRGTAEQLLLIVWGRVPASLPAGVKVSGDVATLDRWAEFVPPM